MIDRAADPGFQAAFADCRQRLARGEALDRCLANYPASYRTDLAEQVLVAERLTGLGQDPAPEFQARLEAHLLAAVDLARQSQPSGLVGFRRRLARWLPASPALRLAGVALVALLIFSTSGAGVLQAANESLPDSPLYRVKTVRESAEVALARDSRAKVVVLSRQVRQRGRELEQAVRTRKPRPVVRMLTHRVAWLTQQIVDEAIDLRSAGDPEPANRAAVQLREMARQSEGLAALAGPDVRPVLIRLHEFFVTEEVQLVGPAPTTG